MPRKISENRSLDRSLNLPDGIDDGGIERVQDVALVDDGCSTSDDHRFLRRNESIAETSLIGRKSNYKQSARKNIPGVSPKEDSGWSFFAF